MAQKVTVALEDDLTGGTAEETVRFAFEGTAFEIDLNAKNTAAFGKQLASYIEHARKAGRTAAIRGTTRVRLPSASPARCDGPKAQVFHLRSNSQRFHGAP